MKLYAANGSLQRTIDVPFQRRPLSPARVAQARDVVLAAACRAVDSARIRAHYDIAKRSGPAPAFTRLVPGTGGTVWIEEFRELRSAATRYVRIDRAGTRIGELQAPPGVRFHEIGDTYAIGVVKDSDDFDMVVLYRIAR